MTVKKYLADLYVIGNLEKLPTKIKYYQEFLDVIGKVDRGYPPVRYLSTNLVLLAPVNFLSINTDFPLISCCE